MNTSKMREEATRWWEKANKDLNSAQYNFKGNRYEEACFFAQQSVEKALKALANIVEYCIKINPVYTESRYPDFSEIESYTLIKSKDILNWSREVLKWVKEKLDL